MPHRGARYATDASVDRGQSSVIGVVLVVAVTVLGITGIMIFGATALQDSQTRSEIDSAEHAMTQLDSQFSLVALGSAERQGASVTLHNGASMTVDGDRGWMNVSVVDRDAGDFEIFNTTLGVVTYENEGTTVAYQGGGVWKKGPSGGSVMVSPPEFHYRTQGGDDPTLTLPLVVVRGSGSTTGEATVTKEETIARFPNESKPDHANPLRGGEINVTVHSEYYQAWGAFFEDRTGGTVTYDHDRERVSIVLMVQQSGDTVSGGIVSGASEELVFGQGAEVDSYNSSEDPYDGTGENTSITAAYDVKLENKAKIKGNLITGGSVSFKNSKSEITGNLTYGGSPPSASERNQIGGWVQSGADVTAPSPVDWLIEDRLDELSESSNNDNDQATGVIDDTNNELTCSSSCKLTAGKYYLEEIDLDGEALELDTSGGDIEIAVAGDVSLKGSDAEINVTGGNTSKLYVEEDLDITSNAEAIVEDDRSPGLWFYMNPDSEAHFQQGTLKGVVYGPGGGAQQGVEITLQSNNRIYGGLVGWLPGGVGQQDEVHFDEALVSVDPLEGYANGAPTVTYLHVTENRVYVTSR